MIQSTPQMLPDDEDWRVYYAGLDQLINSDYPPILSEAALTTLAHDVAELSEAVMGAFTSVAAAYADAVRRMGIWDIDLEPYRTRVTNGHSRPPRRVTRRARKQRRRR